ncbi:MAG: hypothetical protein AB1589_33165 [Cyanobacteriota bacterium]
MTNPKKLVNVYLPESIYQTLIAYQEQQEIEEPSDAVVKILTQFFEKNNVLKRYATVEQLEALEKKVAHLSLQVVQLSQIIASSPPTEGAKTVPTGNSEYTFGDSSFEEAEDEPDEILYEFIEPPSRQ